MYLCIEKSYRDVSTNKQTKRKFARQLEEARIVGSEMRGETSQGDSLRAHYPLWRRSSP